eukprot:scaffold13216_cov197-Skeletonema_dohrnii-CCMP3373.AAC.1
MAATRRGPSLIWLPLESRRAQLRVTVKVPDFFKESMRAQLRVTVRVPDFSGIKARAAACHVRVPDYYWEASKGGGGRAPISLRPNFFKMHI